MNIAIRIDYDRVTGLISENGAGKKTLFKSILQLIHTDGGSITTFGKSNNSISIIEHLTKPDCFSYSNPVL